MKRITILLLLVIISQATVKSQTGINITATGTNSVTSVSPGSNADVYVGFQTSVSASHNNTLLGAGAGLSTGTAVNISDGCYFGFHTGSYAGTATTPSSGDNTFIGFEAGGTNGGSSGSNSFGSGNCFIGSTSGANYNGGLDNTIIGAQSGQNLSGNFNTFIGGGSNIAASPYSSTSGVYIGDGISIGSGATGVLVMGSNVTIGTSVSSCVSIGSTSKIGNSAMDASAIGYGSSIGVSANYSQALGPDASIGAGSTYCTALGQGASVPATPLTYANAIGAGTTVASSYATVIGRAGDIDNVGIGLTNPVAKLDVYRPALTTLVNPIGLQVYNHDKSTSSSGSVWGSKTIIDNANLNNIAAEFDASGAEVSVGVYAVVSTTNIGGQIYPASTGGSFITTSVGGTATGVVGDANGDIISTGGEFNATGSGIDYGIQASASGGTTNYAGYFVGDIYCSGSYLPSDEKLKTNVADYTNAMSRLKNIKTHTYSYQTDQYKEMNLPQGQQTGFLANEFSQSFPELTKNTQFSYRDKTKVPLKYKAINYVGLIPYLVEAMQELDGKVAENDTLRQQIVSLQQQLNDICNGGCASLMGSNTSGQSANPANALLQNVPNPFSQQTTIGYVLNSGTTANMNINSLDGKLVKHIDLAISGQGSVVVSSNEMVPGTYTYSLTVDSKIVDTKLMVITAQN
jgi:hypothetical protein